LPTAQSSVSQVAFRTSTSDAQQPLSTLRAESGSADRLPIALTAAVVDSATNLDGVAQLPSNSHVEAASVSTDPIPAAPSFSVKSDFSASAGDAPRTSAPMANAAPADLSRTLAAPPHVTVGLAPANHDDAAIAIRHQNSAELPSLPDPEPAPEPSNDLLDDPPIARPMIGIHAAQAFAPPRPTGQNSESFAASGSAPAQPHTLNEGSAHTGLARSSAPTSSTQAEVCDRQLPDVAPVADSQKPASSAIPTSRQSAPTASVNAAEQAIPAHATLHAPSAAGSAPATAPAAPSTPTAAISPDLRDRFTDTARRAAVPAPADAFAALDLAATPSTTWVHAGTHQAEAGYLDPALGWVGVRAQVSGGTVHAAIVPGSAEAAQTLGTHIAGLNNYLAEHHSDFLHVTMTAPGHDDAGGAANGHSGASNQQQPRETPAPQTSFKGAPGHNTTTAVLTQAQTQWDAPPFTGVHISVLA
jgi:hypothetical protein